MLLALLSGALGGLGIIALLNRLDDSLRDPEEVSAASGLPCLGAIPSFDSRLSLPDGKKSDEGSGTVAVMAPICVDRVGTPAAEAYRSLRTALLMSRAGGAPQVVAVTSARASEGKTVTALNLAVALASSGSKVLVIDADLRRPAVSRYTGLAAGLAGLSEALSGMSRAMNVVVSTPFPMLSILPAGTCPPNPAELLGSDAMTALLDELKQHYQIIIIDTPPVLPVTDGELVASRADGTILVARSGHTPRAALSAARGRLDMVGARILGVVLNDVDTNEPGYYRGVYGPYTSENVRRAA
jgi:capsular exopolysaccharide synthesis family protein